MAQSSMSSEDMTTTRFVNLDGQIYAELNTSNAVQLRYLRGDIPDEVWARIGATGARSDSQVMPGRDAASSLAKLSAATRSSASMSGWNAARSASMDVSGRV